MNYKFEIGQEVEVLYKPDPAVAAKRRFNLWTGRHTKVEERWHCPMLFSEIPGENRYLVKAKDGLMATFNEDQLAPLTEEVVICHSESLEVRGTVQ